MRPAARGLQGGAGGAGWASQGAQGPGCRRPPAARAAGADGAACAAAAASPAAARALRQRFRQPAARSAAAGPAELAAAASAAAAAAAHEGVFILRPWLGGLGLWFCQFFGAFLCLGVAAKRPRVCCDATCGGGQVAVGRRGACARPRWLGQGACSTATARRAPGLTCRRSAVCVGALRRASNEPAWLLMGASRAACGRRGSATASAPGLGLHSKPRTRTRMARGADRPSSAAGSAPGAAAMPARPGGARWRAPGCCSWAGRAPPIRGTRGATAGAPPGRR